MSSFQEFIRGLHKEKSDCDDFLSNISSDFVDSFTSKRTSTNDPKHHYTFNKKFNNNNNSRLYNVRFNQPRQIHAPKRNEHPEISEKRSDYIKNNFSQQYDVSSNQIVSSFKFNKQTQLLTSWELCGLNPKLYNNIQKIGYKLPREIQKYVIPLMMKDENLEVSARTGCGKTISYIIPLIHKISLLKCEYKYNNMSQLPIAIIVVPTAELVLQVSDKIIKLSKDTNVSCSRVFGGFSPFLNMNEILKGCDIIVGTVGRLNSMLRNSKFYLNNLKYFIVDECDYFIHDNSDESLFDTMNFIEHTKNNKDVQISIFMSISSPSITTFLQRYTGSNFITIKEANSTRYNHIDFISNPNIIHKMYFVTERSKKPGKLLEIIKNIREYDIRSNSSSCTRIIIFTDKIRWSKEITSYVCQEIPHVNCNEFNGWLTSIDREKYLEEFQMNNYEIQILVATDVLCRGIDIYSLNHVINYDLPEHFELFHHRIGRVGRINNGIAHTIIDENDEYDCVQIPNLINLLKNIDQLSEPIKQKFEEMYKKVYHKC